MSMYTVAQLTRASTVAEVEADALLVLQTYGINATSWGPDSVAKALTYFCSRSDAERSQITAQIAASHFNELASGQWLTLLSSSHYDNQRYLATPAVWDMTLRPSSNSPAPISIAVGALVIVATNGQQFTNTSAGTLAAATDLTLQWVALEAGSAGNLSGATSGLLLQTPIIGVSVVNPVATTAGADEETDTSLSARNRTKWATLASGGPTAAYENWARSAEPAVTRVQVDTRNVAANGDIDVYVAGTNGPIGVPAAITAIQDYIMGHDGSVRAVQPRKATLGANVTTIDAAPINASGLNTSCTVYMLTQYYEAGISEAKIDQAVDSFLSTVPIGGVSLDPTSPWNGTLILADLFAAVKAIPGVQNVTFPNIPADLAMTPGLVAMRNTSISVTTVRPI